MLKKKGEKVFCEDCRYFREYAGYDSKTGNRVIRTKKLPDTPIHKGETEDVCCRYKTHNKNNNCVYYEKKKEEKKGLFR